MMFRIRQIIRSITFIGVAFHEFGHQFFCKITGVKVHKVCYYRNGNPAGYVIHDRPKNFIQSFFITVGPLITGSVFAALFFMVSKIEFRQEWLQLFFIWLGGSVALNSFPSDADAKSLWRNTNQYIRNNLIAVLGYPVVLIIWLVNRLYIFWFDLIFTILFYIWVNKLIL